MSLPVQQNMNQFERIQRYMVEPEAGELDANDFATLKRWTFADDQFRDRKTTRKVVNMLVTRFNISKRLAYYDVNHARRLFNFTKMDKEAWVSWLEEQGIELFNKAIEAGDFKAAQAMFGKLMKLAGIGEAGGEIIDPAILSPTIIVQVAQEQTGQPHKGDLQEQIRQFLEQETQKDDAEDIEFSEEQDTNP